jgi:DNA replication and repair protein RecF
MCVLNLVTYQFRNLVDKAQLELHPNLNLIVGANGSGKSSILEAIFLLGHGKSFRTSNIEQLVQFQSDEFVVSIKDDKNNQFGISRSKLANQMLLKFNGSKISKLSDVARYFAVQIITPESFVLFFGGPKARRKFVDLGLFHVEPRFAILWRDFSKVLKQRNACLKSKLNLTTIDYWTDIFCELADQLSIIRSDYVVKLADEVMLWLKVLLPECCASIAITYYRGWAGKKSLKQVLVDNYHRELKFGFSLAGPQKFDVKFSIDGVAIEQSLSRGQQKLFLLALTFAQTSLIARVNQVKPILLIDDFGAELDQHSRKLVASAIKLLDCQVVITTIDEITLEPVVPNDNNFKMFHVKHGAITAIN